MTKITTQHMGALARHIADVLGDADTSRAEVALTAIIGEGATYTDLPVVDVMVVTEGLRDAVVSVPAIRRGTITALFTHVREGAPTCKRCGRLRLQLAGSTWQAVTASTCPVDAGLYDVAVAPVVIGWHDGREYPEGTTHDGEGVPLTEAVIRSERKVDASITAACEETGTTLLEVLAAMPGATPAEALAAIVDPSRKWVSDRALRAFVRDAKGALGRRTGGATPPPFAAGAEAPSGPVDLRALRNALASLYPTDALARRVAWDAGVSVGGVDLAGSSVTRWFNVIEEAVKTGHVGALLTVALREYPSNPALRALSAPTAADRDAVYAALVRLLPAQFEAAVFRLSVPSHVLPGATAPMAERAVALLRIAEQRGQLAQLAAIARAP